MTPPDPSSPFTWNPAEYHKSSSAQQQWAQELITKLGLRGDERVLDIGCGDGKVTAEIARSLPGGKRYGYGQFTGDDPIRPRSFSAE